MNLGPPEYQSGVLTTRPYHGPSSSPPIKLQVGVERKKEREKDRKKERKKERKRKKEKERKKEKTHSAL